MNEIINETRTPIEIALDIDSEGMTTAKKLYAFLELAPSQFSRWCKQNILENEFATENEDYWRFDIDVETPTGGIVKRDDYRLTAHFAKKLSLKGNGEKAEQAREYFTTIEERVKEKAIQHSNLSPQLKLFQQMFEAVAAQEQAAREAKELAQKAVTTTDNIKEAVLPITDNWREEIVKKIRLIQRSCGADFQYLNTEMYAELERRAGCDLNTRLRNKRQRMSESGCRKTDINNTRKLDVIEEDKKLREIYSKIVTEYTIKYCA